MATKRTAITTQPTTTASTNKFGEFRPITGTTGSTIYVLDKGANHPASVKLLEDAGLTLFTENEILSILVKDEQLKATLKGKWFYLAGNGTEKTGLYTINSDGNLTGGKGQSIENTVRVWPGKNPLSLGVDSDDVAADCGWRFLLGASCGPVSAAPVVVGKPKPSTSQVELRKTLHPS